MQSFYLPLPLVLLVCCVVFLVVWWAFVQLGARRWSAFLITWVCVLLTALVVQWLYW